MGGGVLWCDGFAEINPPEVGAERGGGVVGGTTEAGGGVLWCDGFAEINPPEGVPDIGGGVGFGSGTADIGGGVLWCIGFAEMNPPEVGREGKGGVGAGSSSCSYEEDVGGGVAGGDDIGAGVNGTAGNPDEELLFTVARNRLGGGGVWLYGGVMLL